MKLVVSETTATAPVTGFAVPLDGVVKDALVFKVLPTTKPRPEYEPV